MNKKKLNIEPMIWLYIVLALWVVGSTSD